LLSSSSHCASVEGKTPFAMTAINFSGSLLSIAEFRRDKPIVDERQCSGVAGCYGCRTFDFSSNEEVEIVR
jgi:hypothetical protein